MAYAIAKVDLEVTIAAIHTYAALTGDFNPIHVDEAFAGNTAMGGIIAHGTMVSNLIWLAIEATPGMPIEALDLDIRFVAPARPGMTLTAGGQTARDPTTFDLWVRDQNGRTLVTAEAIVRSDSGPVAHRHQSTSDRT